MKLAPRMGWKNPQFFVFEKGRFLCEIDLQEWAIPIRVLVRPRSVLIVQVLCFHLIITLSRRNRVQWGCKKHG